MTPNSEKPTAPALEREASFQLLFHEHPLPMWVVDGETLQFLAVNASAVKKDRDERKGRCMSTSNTARR